MATEIFNASAGDVVVDHFLVIEGGTSGVDEASAREGINAIAAALKGKSQGPVPLDANRFIPAEHLSDLNPTAISINGPLVVECGTTRIYQVTNYDSYTSYAVSAESGFVVMVDNHVFYTAPADEGPCGFTVNGRFISITAVEGLIHAPSIVTPAENFVPLTGNFTVTGSPFESTDTGSIAEVFTSADLEISTDPEFKSLNYAEYGSLSASFNVVGFKPEDETFVRIRYHGVQRVSDWSASLKLKGVLQYVKKPIVAAPIDGQSAGHTDASDPLKQKVVLDVTVSSFEAVNYTDSFQSMDIEISTTMDFSNIVHAAYGFTGSDSSYAGLAKLDYGTLYHLRVRHHGAQKTSVWSDTVTFTTIVDIRSINKPTFVSATLDTSKINLCYVITMSPFVASVPENALSSVTWEVATDPDFVNKFTSQNIADTNPTNTVLELAYLPYSTDCYVRAKYNGTIGTSPWSDTAHFRTVDDDRAVQKPSFTNLTNNQTDVPLTGKLQATPFIFTTSQVSQTDTHQWSDWQIATDSNFTNLVAFRTMDSTNKTEWTPYGMTYSSVYYARVRYAGGIKVSDWSDAIKFTTMADNRTVQTPSVDVSGGQLADTKPIVTGTAFTPQNYTDTHVSTDWQIATDSAFSNIVASSIGNTVSKTQWQPTAALANNTTYYARARYNGSIKSSAYSSGTQFKTVPSGTGQVTVYSADQTVNKPAGVTQVRVELVGPGGVYGPGVYQDTGWRDVQSSAMAEAMVIGKSVTFDSMDPYGGTSYTLPTETMLYENGALLFSVGTVVNNTINPGTGGGSAFPYGSGYYGHATTSAARVSTPSGSKLGATDGAIAITFDVEKAPATPTLSVNGGTSNVTLSPTFSTSAFSQPDRFPSHVNSDWEVATDSGFTNIIKSSYNDTVNKTTWSSSGLSYSSTYFVRVRHRSRYTVSAWSGGVQFTTMADPTPVIGTPGAPVAVFMQGNRFDFVPPALPSAANLSLNEDYLELEFEVYHSRNGRTENGRFRYKYGAPVGTQQPNVYTSTGLTYQSDITYTTASQIFSDLGWGMWSVPSNKGFKINIISTFISEWWTGGGDTFIRVRFIQSGVTSPWSPYSNAVVQGGTTGVDSGAASS